MKRITNLKTATNAEYNLRQWVQVNAIRDRLISATEWTQNGDNLLTLESYILWSEWRRKVYDVSDKTYTTAEEAEAALNKLQDTKPDIVNTSSVMRQKKYRLDLSSLDAAKRDAKRIVKKYVSEYLEDVLPENINIISLKYNDYVNWKDANFFDFEHFPLLKIHQNINVLTVNETIDSIMSLHKLAVNEAAKLVEKEFELFYYIDNAVDVISIIGIVKKMHGY